MIVDCFTFNDELDLLEMRLHELEGAVDYFVLVEAPVTFQGREKPLHFAEHRERFARWPIVPVVADLSHCTGTWERENQQREFIAEGLNKVGLRGDDIVVLSDVDELWRPQALAEPDPFVVFEQTMYVHSLRWRHPKPWNGSTACRASILPELGANPFTTLRCTRLHDKPKRLSQGGWHFSWFGGPEAQLRKLYAFAHEELVGVIDDELTSGHFVRNGLHVDCTSLEPAGDNEPLPLWMQRRKGPLGWYR